MKKTEEILTCGACGRQCEAWQEDRCPVCEALHYKDALAKFKLTITLDSSVKSLLMDDTYDPEFIHKVTANKIAIIDITEKDLRMFMSLGALSQFIWHGIIKEGSYKIGFLSYKWEQNA